MVKVSVFQWKRYLRELQEARSAQLTSNNMNPESKVKGGGKVKIEPKSEPYTPPRVKNEPSTCQVKREASAVKKEPSTPRIKSEPNPSRKPAKKRRRANSQRKGNGNGSGSRRRSARRRRSTPRVRSESSYVRPRYTPQRDFPRRGWLAPVVRDWLDDLHRTPGGRKYTWSVNRARCGMDNVRKTYLTDVELQDVEGIGTVFFKYLQKRRDGLDVETAKRISKSVSPRAIKRKQKQRDRALARERLVNTTDIFLELDTREKPDGVGVRFASTARQAGLNFGGSFLPGMHARWTRGGQDRLIVEMMDAEDYIKFGAVDLHALDKADGNAPKVPTIVICYNPKDRKRDQQSFGALADLLEASHIIFMDRRTIKEIVGLLGELDNQIKTQARQERQAAQEAEAADRDSSDTDDDFFAEEPMLEVKQE